MKRILIIYVAVFLAACGGSNNPQKPDWLIEGSRYKANIQVSDDGKDLVMTNGLVKRSFRLKPNIACTSYENLVNGQQLLRAVKPEAELIIDGKKYNVGGLYGQKEQAYLLPEWVDSFTSGENDFQLVSYTESPLEPIVKWKKTMWAGKNKQPSGKMISMLYKSNILNDVEITVHYELYDGIPLMVKWLTIDKSGHSIQLNRVVNEKLALVEEESAVVGTPEQMKKQHGIYIETNYAFNNAMRYDISDQTTHWNTDPTYTSQVNYNYQTPCLLEIYPEKVTGVDLASGETFNSVRTHELLMDSYDRDRRGLAIRKMYRTVAPWTNENPIFMHLISRNDDEVRKAVEQCVETGYEAVILSFGSHCNMEDTTAANIRNWKELADFAHSKGIKIGGYSLLVPEESATKMM